MSKWRETVGVGFGTARNAGTDRKHVVLDENTGKRGGYHVEHWDGAQDAVAQPRPVKMKLGMQEG